MTAKKPANSQKAQAAKRAAKKSAHQPIKPAEPAPKPTHDERGLPYPQRRTDRPNREGPAREIAPEERFEIPELPEPADFIAVLVALSKMDPLAQEVMIAERLGAMPSQRDGGMPVNIPRMVRPAWANQLRKLGIFCIPELATHELVAPDGAGILINHTAGTMATIDRTDLWERAKAMNPELGRLVEDAETPEQKKAAMKLLAAKLPAEQRIAMERLMQTAPEQLEPT